MKEFYDQIRRSFGSFSQKQVDGINAIYRATEGLPIPHRAYIMATAWHETDKTMQPIAEYGKGRGKAYGKPGKHGQPQYGRGYVQLTWDANYERADRELSLGGALLKNFDLALDAAIAAKILVRGMTEGWFTGKKLSDYSSYVDMRRIVNGTDKAALIAGHAASWEAAFRAVPLSSKPVGNNSGGNPAANPTPSRSFMGWILYLLTGGKA